MSTDIYYFSGTGNSLYVAKGLQGRIEGARLIPIASLMDQETHRITAPTVGFVFPTLFHPEHGRQRPEVQGLRRPDGGEDTPRTTSWSASSSWA